MTCSVIFDPVSCQGVNFGPQEVLGRSQVPAVVRMSLLATEGICNITGIR